MLARAAACAVAALLLAACAGEVQPEVPDATGTPAPVPPSESAPEASASVPAGWEIMEDDTGSLRVALPPDLLRIEGFPGVSAQLATEPPTFAIEVHAAAAPDLQPPKPWTESAVEAWLLDRLGGWVGVDQVTHSATSVVELPAGEAIQVRAQLRPEGSDVIEIVSYAIPGATGVADLHIIALTEYWETRGDDLELIPQLLDLGD